VGRPSEYTPEIAEAICDGIIEGKSIKTICKADELPSHTTVFKWLASNREFADLYARAKDIQAEVMSEDLLDIVDDGTNDWTLKTFGHTEVKVVDQEAVQRSKLRYEARRWLMSKYKPKKFGDKMDLNVSGELTLAARIAKARALRAGSGGE
jgi:hypothetical protein